MGKDAVVLLAILVFIASPIAVVTGPLSLTGSASPAPVTRGIIDHPSIASWIGNASEGDTILIPPGTFHENLVIDRSVTLVGSGANGTIIDGSGTNCTIVVNADHVTLIGMTIRNSGTGEGPGHVYDSGIQVNADHLSVIGCSFANNSRVSIYFNVNGDHTMVHGCDFTGPTMNHIRCSTREIEYLSVVNCTFRNDGYQMIFYHPYSVRNVAILGNSFVNTDPGSMLSTAISFSFWGRYGVLWNATICGNTFYGAEDGINLNAGVDAEISYNTFEECKNHGVIVSTSIETVIHHNNFMGTELMNILGQNEDVRVDWNDTKGRGNHWSDYAKRYPSATNDGTVWDRPFQIEGAVGAFDHHPLVHPVTDISVPEFGPMLAVPGHEVNLRCGQGFSIPFDMFDPDTPIDSLNVSIPSGPEWMTLTKGGVLRGTVPPDEGIGSREYQVVLTDGHLGVTRTLRVRILPEALLIGRWNMSVADRVLDSSGYGRDGVLFGDAEWIRGANGTGVWMDGDGDRIEIEDFGSDSPEFTICLCIYPVSIAGIYEHVLSIGSYPRDKVSLDLSIDRAGGGRLAYTEHVSGERIVTLNGISTVRTDEWTSVVVTYDGFTARFYMNGTLERSMTKEFSFPTNSTMVLGDIGDHVGFMGVMDSVLVYNYAISEEEVSTYHSSHEGAFAEYLPLLEKNSTIDRDRDALPDRWELLFFEHLQNGPLDDPDSDGYPNAEEFELGSNPADDNDPAPEWDRDMDGLRDEWEMTYFGDLFEGPYGDADGDGYSNREEHDMDSDPTDKRDPAYRYGDGDELPDNWELRYFGDLDQRPHWDYDGDGYDNLEEYKAGTDPTDPRDHPGWADWGIVFILIGMSVVSAIVVLGIYFLIRFVSKDVERGNGTASKAEVAGAPSKPKS